MIILAVIPTVVSTVISSIVFTVIPPVVFTVIPPFVSTVVPPVVSAIISTVIPPVVSTAVSTIISAIISPVTSAVIPPIVPAVTRARAAIVIRSTLQEVPGAIFILLPVSHAPGVATTFSATAFCPTATSTLVISCDVHSHVLPCGVQSDTFSESYHCLLCIFTILEGDEGNVSFRIVRCRWLLTICHWPKLLGEGLHNPMPSKKCQALLMAAFDLDVNSRHDLGFLQKPGRYFHKAFSGSLRKF
mmetsp:Transcript_79373/g.140097  ORF Transcript_79373/g.140097 Transcript_79373/m.140097 type:complete len:245 (-) Transcript_79373:110-844(-)